jgi:hypothetical protein
MSVHYVKPSVPPCHVQDNTEVLLVHEPVGLLVPSGGQRLIVIFDGCGLVLNFTTKH